MKSLVKILLVSIFVLTIIGCGGGLSVKRYFHSDRSVFLKEAGFESKDELTEEYVLGPADVIGIRVWGYEDLTQVVTIPPNGIATFFPLGKIKVSGLTSSELEEVFKEKLKSYVKEIPSVTVVVKEYNYYKIYVLGEINKAGLYPYPGRVTLLEAITMAGTYTSRAELSRVNVVRVSKKDPSVATVLTVNLKDVIKKGDISQDVVLRPGDIVFVPSSVMANINDVINQVTPSVSTVYYVDALLE